VSTARAAGIFARLVAVVAVAYGLAAGYMYALQRDFLFRPSGTLGAPHDLGLDGVAAERVDMQDGTAITVWHKPPAEPENPIVLYFHGNGGNLSGRAERYRQIIDSGLGLYAPTYRGYPGAGGAPSEAALIADALEHFDRAQAAAGDVVLHGESLGTGIAVAVAAERPARALILEAPFTGAVDVAAAAYPWLPVSLLMKDPFISRDRIGDVEEPLLVVHGTADRTIPFNQGRALYDMANQPKELRVHEGAGHTQLWTGGLWPAALDFLVRNSRTDASNRP
jgi:fermentation-respiration switch protein FrsA (DUF1100 family)